MCRSACRVCVQLRQNSAFKSFALHSWAIPQHNSKPCKCPSLRCSCNWPPCACHSLGEIEAIHCTYPCWRRRANPCECHRRNSRCSVKVCRMFRATGTFDAYCDNVSAEELAHSPVCTLLSRCGRCVKPETM